MYISLCNRIVILSTALLLSACGFTPVHSNKGVGKELNEAFATIEVAPIGNTREGQLLRGHLEDSLNPSGAAFTNPARYRLNISLKKRTSPISIEQNREVTRYNMTVTTNYTLRDLSNDKVVDMGKTRMVSSFDAVESDFATFTAEQDTLADILRETAQDIKFRLTDYLLRQANES